MAKKKPEIRMVSFGRYTPFDKTTKDLPKILEFTTTIPAELGVEFGYILEIKKSRGEKLSFCIDHPPFCDDSGEIAPPFVGEVHVQSSDWRFFLGDTVWLPLDDKLGKWTLTASLMGKEIARKTFTLVAGENPVGKSVDNLLQ